jgi:hypothetical protein
MTDVAYELASRVVWPLGTKPPQRLTMDQLLVGLASACPIQCPGCGDQTGRVLYRMPVLDGIQLSCTCGWWTVILPPRKKRNAAKYRRHWPDGR